MSNIFSMVDTWNEGSTAFTAIKMNVTDTASAAASLLMDLQVGGTSKFRVDKTGKIYTPWGHIGNQSGDLVIANDGLNVIYLNVGGATRAAVLKSSIGTTGGIGLGTQSLGFGVSATNSDLVLTRDAAGVLAQRKGANPQAFRVYNTYTDAANYEFGGLSWSGNELRLTAEAAGTGVRRNVGIYFNPSDNNAGRVNISQQGVSVYASYVNIGKGGATGIIAIDDLGFTLNGVGTAVPIKIKGLPTTDPAVLNQLWNDGGTVKISAG